MPVQSDIGDVQRVSVLKVAHEMLLSADNNNGPGGWLRLFVEQSGGQAAVSLVQVRTSNSGSAWTSLNNVYGSDWEINTSPAYPLDVSIVGPDGQTVRFKTVQQQETARNAVPISLSLLLCLPDVNYILSQLGSATDLARATSLQ